MGHAISDSPEDPKMLIMLALVKHAQALHSAPGLLHIPVYLFQLNSLAAANDCGARPMGEPRTEPLMGQMGTPRTEPRRRLMGLMGTPRTEPPSCWLDKGGAHLLMPRSHRQPSGMSPPRVAIPVHERNMYAA